MKLTLVYVDKLTATKCYSLISAQMCSPLEPMCLILLYMNFRLGPTLRVGVNPVEAGISLRKES